MTQREPSVEEFWATLEHPLAESARLLRGELLGAASGVVENIKWKAPNYALADDFATFNLRRPALVQLIFHTGATPKPDHPPITVDALTSFVRWPDRNRAVVTFSSDAEVREALPEFAAFVRSWVAQLIPH